MGVHDPDAALLVAHRDGDPDAFDTLFARYSPMLLRIMRRGVDSEADAHDLVQQTFLQLHRARADFRASAPLRPWLLTIAMNLKRGYWRRAKRWRQTELGDDLTAPPGPDPAQREAVRQLYVALKALPDNQREVIELHWLEEIPMAEVAQIVGASRSAVKVRAHRGYKRLRGLLADVEPGPVRPLWRMS